MDKDPSQARIVFNLSRQDVPELLAHLGSFALNHDLAFVIGDSPADVKQPSLSAERQAFNADLVTFLQTDESAEPIPVVTKQNLTDFARSQGKEVIAGRLIRQLGNSARKDKGLKEMLYGKEGTYWFEAEGIRVERLSELCQSLNDGSLYVMNVGVMSITILNDYCNELFLEFPKTQS